MYVCFVKSPLNVYIRGVIKFFQKCLFIYQQPTTNPRTFKLTPLRYYTLMPAFFPNPQNTSETRFLESPTAPVSIFLLSPQNVAKRLPFISVFSFGKRKKSPVAKSDEYCGWGMITGLFLVKNSYISIDVWAGALVFHNSVCFWRTASRNRRKRKDCTLK